MHKAIIRSAAAKYISSGLDIILGDSLSFGLNDISLVHVKYLIHVCSFPYKGMRFSGGSINTTLKTYYSS